LDPLKIETNVPSSSIQSTPIDDLLTPGGSIKSFINVSEVTTENIIINNDNAFKVMLNDGVLDRMA